MKQKSDNSNDSFGVQLLAPFTCGMMG
jgi:hypothetical protein